jgi:hypothetical protein
MGDAIGTGQIIVTALSGFVGAVVGSLISWGVQANLLRQRITADQDLAEKKANGSSTPTVRIVAREDGQKPCTTPIAMYIVLVQPETQLRQHCDDWNGGVQTYSTASSQANFRPMPR